MADKTLDLKLRISADGSVAVDGLRRVGDAVEDVGEGAQQAGDPIEAMGAKLLALGASALAVDRLKAAITDVIQTSDGWQRMAAQIEAANSSIGDGAARLEDVAAAALRTNRELDATQALYTALERSSESLRKSQAAANRVSDENLKITEAIGNAIRIAGTDAQAASGALRQLAQGLESGTLRGDELNSVLEQMPAIATAITREMRISRAELRQYAEQGQITADVVRAAVLGMADEWEAQASRMPQTLDDALTNLETRWQRYIGSVEAAQDASAALVGFLDGIGENLEAIASVAGEGALLLVSAALLQGAQAAGQYAAGLYKSTGAQVEAAAAAARSADAEAKLAAAARSAAAARAQASAASLTAAEQQAAAAARMAGADRSAVAAAEQALRVAQQRERTAASQAATEARLADRIRQQGGNWAAYQRAVERASVAQQRHQAAVSATTAATQALTAAEQQYLAAARGNRAGAMATAEKALATARRDHAAATRELTSANLAYTQSAAQAERATAAAAASSSRMSVVLGQVRDMAKGLAGALSAVPYILIIDQLLKIADGIGKIVEQYKEMDRIRRDMQDTESRIGDAIRANLRLYADAAQTRIRTEEELAGVTRAAADEYLGQLRDAARYWAAVETQARRAGDAQAAAHAQEQVERYNAALAEQTALIDELIARQVRLSPVAQALSDAFDKLREKGKGAAESLAAVTEGLRFDSAAEAMVNTAAVAELITSLGTANEEAGQKIRATERDIREGLAPTLDAMTAGSLRNFAAEWEKALAALDGEPVATVAAVMDTVLRAALGRLKLDLDDIRTGTTAAGRELLEVFQAVAIAAEGDLAVVREAWEQVLAGLGSTADIERARALLERLGSEGRISLEQLRDATEDLDRAQARLVATTGEVAEAFKRLGVQSSEQLRLIAEDALRDYELIRDSGVASARDIEAAWAAYAERAIASGDAVQQQIARQEGALLGLADRYRELTGQQHEQQRATDRSTDATQRLRDVVADLRAQIASMSLEDAPRLERALKKAWESGALAAEDYRDLLAELQQRQEALQGQITDAELRARGVSRSEYEAGITRRVTRSYQSIYDQYGRQPPRGFFTSDEQRRYWSWVQENDPVVRDRLAARESDDTGPTRDDIRDAMARGMAAGRAEARRELLDELERQASVTSSFGAT